MLNTVDFSALDLLCAQTAAMEGHSAAQIHLDAGEHTDTCHLTLNEQSKI